MYKKSLLVILVVALCLVLSCCAVNKRLEDEFQESTVEITEMETVEQFSETIWFNEEASEVSVTDSPTQDCPTTEPPVTEPSATKPSATEPPVTETPAPPSCDLGDTELPPV